MALVGNTFYQASSLDPGAGYPMYFWAQTNTGLLYIRNAADNAWVLVGDSAQPYLGQLSTQGGAMNGAITGAHGLSPDDSNDFTSLYVGGSQVTTKAYVDAQVLALNASIATGIAGALASVPALNLGTRVAKLTGQWTGSGVSAGNVIPLPKYSPDNTTAQERECIWGVSFAETSHGGSFAGQDVVFTLEETANRTYTVTGQVTPSAGAFVWTVDWWIIAFRTTS
jgi:hypothetical protein